MLDEIRAASSSSSSSLDGIAPCWGLLSNLGFMASTAEDMTDVAVHKPPSFCSSKPTTALRFLLSPELSLALPHHSLLCYLWYN